MIKLGVVSLDHPHSHGNHFPALRYIQDRVKVHAIAHPDRQYASPWLDMFSARYFADKQDLLACPDIDAVLITSTNNLHAADTIAAARAGKDIFCDKPIATTLDDVHAMVAAVRQHNVRFVTTYPVRFNTSVSNLKAAIDDGRFGRITAIMATNHGCMYEPDTPAWVEDPLQNGGGCLIDHTVHVADIIRWLTGAEFDTVRAFTDSALRTLTAEDIAVLHGRLSDDTLYQIDASWSRRGRDPMWGDVTFRIVGTKGSAWLDLYNNQRIEIVTSQGVQYRYPNHLVREHGEIFLEYLQHRDHLSSSRCADDIDGLRTMELVFAAYTSVRDNSEISIEKYSSF